MPFKLQAWPQTGFHPSRTSTNRVNPQLQHLVKVRGSSPRHSSLQIPTIHSYHTPSFLFARHSRLFSLDSHSLNEPTSSTSDQLTNRLPAHSPHTDHFNNPIILHLFKYGQTNGELFHQPLSLLRIILIHISDSIHLTLIYSLGKSSFVDPFHRFRSFIDEVQLLHQAKSFFSHLICILNPIKSIRFFPVAFSIHTSEPCTLKHILTEPSNTLVINTIRQNSTFS